MRKILFPLLILALYSCKKNVNNPEKELADTLAKIDSINAARIKHNDSIKILNNKNRFADLSGNHKLTFNGDGAKMNGIISMKKVGQDEYEVTSNIKSGSNFLKIEGIIKKISEKHLNFEGKISQKIAGSTYSRNKKTTFFDEGKGNFWRLQDKINGDGFVDYIDIYK